jgi:DNA-binding MarR family transcriptional regulator
VGLIDSLFRFFAALPENANLRLQLNDAHVGQSKSDQENASLKDDLRAANAKIKQLEKQNQELSHDKYGIKEEQIEILKMLADRGGRNVDRFAIAKKLQLHIQAAEYHIQRLIEIGYITIPQFQSTVYYDLTQQGREFLVRAKHL